MQDREKWDARYAQGAYQSRDWPSPFVQAWLPRVARGRALDLACGIGRNARYLATQGFQVDAVDISGVGLDRAKRLADSAGASVRWNEADLELEPPPPGPYNLVILMRYVNLELIGRIPDILAPAGMFLCEQHMVSTEATAGPSDPAFRVLPGQLSELVPALAILESNDGVITDPDGQTVALSRLVAKKPRH